MKSTVFEIWNQNSKKIARFDRSLVTELALEESPHLYILGQHVYIMTDLHNALLNTRFLSYLF